MEEFQSPPVSIARVPAPLESLFPELRQLPRQPPRREMLPGLTVKAGLRSPALLLLPIFLLFSVFIGVMSLAAYQVQSRQQRVSGRVIQVEHFGVGHTFLKFRYAVGSRTFTGAAVDAGSFAPWTQLKLGAPLDVGFDPKAPQNGAPMGQAQPDFPWPLLLLFPLMASAFFGFGFLPQIRAFFLARKLLAGGALANGQIRFCKVTGHQTPFNANGHSMLFYGWIDHNGTPQRGSMRCDNAWLVQQLHAQAPVVVAYDLNRPNRNILLEPFVA